MEKIPDDEKEISSKNQSVEFFKEIVKKYLQGIYYNGVLFILLINIKMI